MPAYPTFPEPRGLKYHRVCKLSLLCSEWEEVVHLQIKHRQTKILEIIGTFTALFGMGRGGPHMNERPANSEFGAGQVGMFPFCLRSR